MDNEIFKYLDPNSNSKLSDLSGLDLQELISLIDKYYLVYRKKLGIDKDYTFGFEIEFSHADFDTIEESMSNYGLLDKWETTTDSSLFHGMEIISPVLCDKKKCWREFYKICEIISPVNEAGKEAGSHIHIGSHLLGDKKRNWLQFIKLWSVYENIMYRFLYGEYLEGRPRILEFAEPVSRKLNSLYERFINEKSSLDNIIHTLLTTVDRYSAVEFQNVDKKHLEKYKKHNTIEFRAANGTIDPVIWQNNLNTLMNLLLYSKSSKYNLDIIEKRATITDYKFELYDEIYLDQALEFCDLVFNNNFDKVYFLKQYLKSFEFQNYKKEYSKAKSITKK